MRHRPILGVTGLSSGEEAERLFANAPVSTMFQYMAGFHPQEQVVLQDVFPTNMPDILKILNYYPDSEYRSKERFGEGMSHVMRMTGPHCNGLQITGDWPSLETLMEFRKKGSVGYGATVILYVSRAMLENFGFASRLLCSRLAHYKGLVDYVFIDPSGKGGKSYDPVFVFHILDRLATLDWLNVGLAGVIKPDVHQGNLALLFKNFPKTSFQTGRQHRDEKGTLIPQKAHQFLLQMAGLYEGKLPAVV